MTKIDGRKIAKELGEELKKKVESFKKTPRLIIFQIGEDFASKQFISIKQKKAKELGIETEVMVFGENDDPENVKKEIQERIEKAQLTESAIIQLPLPGGFNTDEFIDLIPASMDVDVLTSKAKKEGLFEAPVAGAVREVLQRNMKDWKDKSIAVLGEGKLVGFPVAEWLKSEGVDFEVFDEDRDIEIQNADIVISGTGVPGLVQPSMIKEGVCLIDAGTSEQGGKTFGDISSDCYQKCSLYTPAPGGIGPITVMILMQNVLKRLEKEIY
jgi:methylenetetrahydrofolate dehydrogenase (NADP+)/methenyltetrahydrofolate cyclohydrolase